MLFYYLYSSGRQCRKSIQVVYVTLDILIMVEKNMFGALVHTVLYVLAVHCGTACQMLKMRKHEECCECINVFYRNNLLNTEKKPLQQKEID